MSRLTLTAKIDLASLRSVQRALDKVKAGVANRVVKGAVAKAARSVARVARQDAPQGSVGVVRKSIGVKYKSYERGMVWAYLIGPRRGFRMKGPGGKDVVATRVGHFAEAGRKSIAPKPGTVLAFFTLKGSPASKRRRKVSGAIFTRKPVKAAAGFFFMQKAWGETKGLKTSIERDILAGVMREATKAAAAGKSIYT